MLSFSLHDRGILEVGVVCLKSSEGCCSEKGLARKKKEKKRRSVGILQSRPTLVRKTGTEGLIGAQTGGYNTAVAHQQERRNLR